MSNNTAQTITEQLNNNHPDAARVLQLARELDITDSDSIVNFGTQAQQKLTAVADALLADTTGEHAGEAGALLNEMVQTLHGFRGSELKVADSPSFFAKLFGRNKPLETFLEKFDTVSDQIDIISNALETHKQTLLIDIKALDNLYNANLDYYYDLEHYIAAGEEVIRHTDEDILPELKSQAEYRQTAENQKKLYSYQSRRDELEQRLHDMRLTKQVAMQALPGIRLVQENNKKLVSKINSTLVNTIPLWRQQLARSVAIFRSHEAATAIKQSNDLTNDLLITNARMLKDANAESRRQAERGVFDIACIEKTNQLLIETIEESISIHETGRKEREEAVARLQAAENALKHSLLQATVTGNH